MKNRRKGRGKGNRKGGEEPGACVVSILKFSGVARNIAILGKKGIKKKHIKKSYESQDARDEFYGSDGLAGL